MTIKGANKRGELQDQTAGELSPEQVAAEKRTKMLKAIEMLIVENQSNATTPLDSSPSIDNQHTNQSITGSIPKDVTLSLTIKCKLPDLINNEPCKLVTEETLGNQVVYSFGPLLVDDSTDFYLTPQQMKRWDMAPSMILTPLPSKSTSVETTSNASPSKSTSQSTFTSSSSIQSNNLLDALSPGFDPKSLDLLAASNRNQSSPNSTKAVNYSNMGKYQRDLISFDNLLSTPSMPPLSSVSSMSLSPSTSSSTSSHTSLQPLSPLVYHPSSSTSSIVPPAKITPSSTTKDPLVHHPTHARYSNTSFYRAPKRTIVNMRRSSPSSPQ